MPASAASGGTAPGLGRGRCRGVAADLRGQCAGAADDGAGLRRACRALAAEEADRDLQPLGSIANNNGGRYAYRASKTALNMEWKCLSPRISPAKGVICVVLHPGWVQTDMGGPARAAHHRPERAGDGEGDRRAEAVRQRPLPELRPIRDCLVSRRAQLDFADLVSLSGACKDTKIANDFTGVRRRMLTVRPWILAISCIVAALVAATVGRASRAEVSYRQRPWQNFAECRRPSTPVFPAPAKGCALSPSRSSTCRAAALVIKIVEPGRMAPTPDMLDAVIAGDLEAAFTWRAMPPPRRGFQVFATVPFGPGPKPWPPGCSTATAAASTARPMRSSASPAFPAASRAQGRRLVPRRPQHRGRLQGRAASLRQARRARSSPGWAPRWSRCRRASSSISCSRARWTVARCRRRRSMLPWVSTSSACRTTCRAGSSPPRCSTF